jgi:glycosyltransferase involved in cell wall biosynthesis
VSRSTLRLLVLVVAYNAEDTLCAVLDRIPPEVLHEYHCEVLVIDDASTDTTFERGLRYRRSRPELPLTVLRNADNQGYGGNQKLGYSYAVTEGFDLVALIHGDGQYAPEELPRLLAPLASGDADAVLGSRMLVPGAARRGGMPLYKFLGNKILSSSQNRLAGAQLSEWHSGYRLYRVSLLARLRFRANRDDFCFDTEIILQMLNARANIVELPIPTYYGDEICRVDGLRYAGQVIHASARGALHRLRVVHQHYLTPVTDGSARHGNEHYDVKLDYRSSHSEALSRIRPGSRVLDLGGGPGTFASLVADRGAHVATADLHPPTSEDQRVTTHIVDLNAPLSLPLDGYDHVLLLDVIEHLHDPERFMEDLRLKLAAQPREVIITTPNVAFLSTRLMLLFGQFNYTTTGILDRTHTRLFTFRSLRRLLRDAGFTVQEMRGVPAPFPKAVGSRRLASLLLRVNEALIRVAPRLFSYQILVVATNRPHVDHLLAETRGSVRVRAA